MKKALLVALAAAVALALIVGACSRPDPVAQVPATVVQPAQSSPPVVVQQSSNDGFWQNVFLYHMLFGSNTTVVHHYDTPRSSYVAPSRTTVQNTTIVNKTVVQSAPRPAPAAGVAQAPTRPSAPTTSYSPPRATSYSGSYSSRPSYSSYSSRASFSSGRR
jgi:hypothetical protein